MIPPSSNQILTNVAKECSTIQAMCVYRAGPTMEAKECTERCFVRRLFDGLLREQRPDEERAHRLHLLLEELVLEELAQPLVKSSQVYDTREANGVMPSDHPPVLTTFIVK